MEDEEVLPSGSMWEYLLYAPGDVPADPSTADPDFYSTWALGGPGYNGPAFMSGAAPLGYDVVTGDPLVTDIWGGRGGLASPPSGNRRTAYFRTTITPTAATSSLRFTGILDDGAVVYVNGVEVGRSANMNANPDLWDLLATATGSETVPQTIDAFGLSLPGGVPAVIGVSVHSQSLTSSDMGMNFRIVTLTPPTPEPPVNDNFANAEVLLSDLPQTVAGRTHDLANGLGATRQAGEPMHGGVANVGSIWYTVQPTADARVSVSVAGSSFNAVVSVYTGTTLANLTQVASSADASPFYPAGTVIVNAQAGVTYWIAIDGESNGGAPVLNENYGNTSLTLTALPDSLFTTIATLLPAGSNWYYLLPSMNDAIDPLLTNQPFDPETVDPDFDTTWYTEAGYNGPDFQGPAPALLGYGVIDAGPLATDIWGGRDIDGDDVADAEPPTGLRYAAYFWTTFTPTTAVAHLGFRGLIDDGATIYINGREVSNINFLGDPTDWTALAANATNTETGPQEGLALGVNLPANTRVEIGVVVRNNSAASSDMGFDLEVYSIEAPVIDFGKPLLTNDPMLASFDTDTVGTGTAGSNGNLPFQVISGAVLAESSLPNPPPAGGNALYVNNGAISFISGNIDLAGVDNSGVTAAFDLRVVDTSSGFENNDNMEAWLEGSTDGLLFSRVATIMPLTVGADPVDPFTLLQLPDGAYTTFSSNPSTIPAGIRTVRIVIQGVNNSGSEHLFVDNVAIGTSIGPPPPFVANISHNRVTGANTITWESDGNSVYEVDFGDLQGWVTIVSDFDITSATHTPPAGTTRAYYRVRQIAD